MKKYPEFSKEEIEHIVKQCFTFSDVCRLMQRPTNSENLRVIHKKLDTLNIDYSHFKGQGWNKGTSQPSHKKIPIEKILIENSTYQNTDRLKKRLISEGYKIHKCEICGITQWNNKYIALQLHHINGISNDNRIDNLQILCPNCHSQTENYGSKNIK